MGNPQFNQSYQLSPTSGKPPAHAPPTLNMVQGDGNNQVSNGSRFAQYTNAVLGLHNTTHSLSPESLVVAQKSKSQITPS